VIITLLVSHEPAASTRSEGLFSGRSIGSFWAVGRGRPVRGVGFHSWPAFSCSHCVDDFADPVFASLPDPQQFQLSQICDGQQLEVCGVRQIRGGPKPPGRTAVPQSRRPRPSDAPGRRPTMPAERESPATPFPPRQRHGGRAQTCGRPRAAFRGPGRSTEACGG
jgi:hypothetical protein